MLTVSNTGVLCCVLLATAGCFRYTQVPLENAPIGEKVRVRMSETALQRLLETVGGNSTESGRTIEGVLLQVNERDLLLAIPVASRGLQTPTAFHQRAVVRHDDVMELCVKQLDRQKTAVVLATAGAALSAILMRFVIGEYGGTTKPPPDPGPLEAIVRANRIPY
jgi:hypothetical protein